TTTNFTYGANGNRTASTIGSTTLSSATWNGANELTSYSDASANMTASSYNGEGLRTSATATPSGGSSSTQAFVWNTLGSVPQLLMDGKNAYLYGPGPTPIEQVNLSSGTIQYLASDALGSVRGVVSSTGALTASTAYGAYGNPETTGGLTSYTPFGFAGGYTDPTGLVYLVNRYYDPGTGQFMSVDPLVDQTGQAYGYTGGNPVNGVDPLGLCSDAGGTFLVPGACHWTSRSWVMQTENTLQGQKGGGFSWTNGLKAVADYGTGIANFAVSTATLGNGHVSAPYCGFGWASDVGYWYAAGATFVLGGAEADAANATETSVNEGVYVIRSTGGNYVGQSGNIDQRLAGYVSSGRFTQAEVDAAERTLATGGKTAREVAEQLQIDSMGGVDNLLNIRNPIGDGRVSLMPQPYARP
ncbi:MAG: hypothetical protein JWO62_16, partial [Acidimicrobiaceae bacterium]|nr:hypothetical protein [Acidimicrobiaceae bacterium]